MSNQLPAAIPQGLSVGDWRAHRTATLRLFSDAVYGVTPAPPDTVEARPLQAEEGALGGKALHRALRVAFDAPLGEASFPMHLVLPYASHPIPVMIFLSFSPYMRDSAMPMEEIIDAGWGVAHIDYNDITKDADDAFASGIAPLYPREGHSAWGKLGMWAYGASRALDALLAQPGVDPRRIHLLGHSRLGKAALWCAAQDERIAGVGVNDSGCSGIAITRGKQGERVADITARFGYWFCENYRQYAGREDDMPFDQHMLAALIAPRPLCVCNATLDTWADPDSEYRALRLASAAYALHGLDGLVGTRALPPAGVDLSAGRIGYRLRAGTHFLGREDWAFYLRFFAGLT